MTRSRTIPRAAIAALSVGGDVLIAAAFMATWLDPDGRWARPVGFLLLTMLFEFIAIHSSAFMGSVWLGDGDRAKKFRVMVSLAGFYLLFVAGYALAFRSWIPIVAFGALVVNRLMSLLLDPSPDEDTKERVERGWARATVFYVGFAGITTLFPIPRFGLDDAAVRAADLSGSGAWIDEPHRVVAFGFAYFALTALFEFRSRWRELTPHADTDKSLQHDRVGERQIDIEQSELDGLAGHAPTPRSLAENVARRGPINRRIHFSTWNQREPKPIRPPID